MQKVFTNIHSLMIPNCDITYFTNLEEITNNIEKNAIFIIDEISKKYTKNSFPDKAFLSWLQQSRKRGRIVILITQVWKQVPMWLRDPCRFVYTTHKARIPFINIFITSKGDGLNLFLNDAMEWECPILSYTVYKRTKYISNMYDTFEPINTL